MDKRTYICTFCDTDVPHADTRVRDGVICCQNCRFATDDELNRVITGRPREYTE